MQKEKNVEIDNILTMFKEKRGNEKRTVNRYILTTTTTTANVALH